MLFAGELRCAESGTAQQIDIDMILSIIFRISICQFNIDVLCS